MSDVNVEFNNLIIEKEIEIADISSECQKRDIRIIRWNAIDDNAVLREEKSLFVVKSVSFIKKCFEKKLPFVVVDDQIMEKSEEAFGENERIKNVKYVISSFEGISIHYLNRIYCHQIGKPAFIAEFDDILLRELSVKDWCSVKKVCDETEKKYIKEDDLFCGEKAYEKFVAYVDKAYDFFDAAMYGVFLKDTGSFIGFAGFREGTLPYEVGYVISKDHRNKGFAVKALKAVLRYAKDELEDGLVYAKINDKNIASVKVAVACGFTKVQNINDYSVYKYGAL